MDARVRFECRKKIRYYASMEKSETPEPLNLRQRYALAIWMLYWISYLTPAAYDTWSFGNATATTIHHSGWSAAWMAMAGCAAPFLDDSIQLAKEWPQYVCGVAYTINNLLMLFVVFWVRRNPTRFQFALFLSAALINITAPFIYSTSAHFGFYLWVATFVGMACALRLPNTGRPLQVSLRTLFLTLVLGGGVALPLIPYLADNQDDIPLTAGLAVGVILLVALPMVILFEDLRRSRREKLR